MYCKQCGAHIDDDVKFCPSCGQPVTSVCQADVPALRPVSANQEKCPSNHLLMAVLVTLFCCLPFGIIIIYASKVDTAWRDGYPEMAQSYSRKAKNWALWGFIPILIFYLLCFIVLALAVAVGMDITDSSSYFV